MTAAPAVAGPTTKVTCGQTLTHSVRLANDLANCPADGLIVGSDNITVDLNGHTIDGVVAQAADCNVPPFGVEGINNDAGHDGLTIEDGTVQQFANGVGAGSETTSMSDSLLRDLTVRDNRFSGIEMGSAGVLFDDNRIEHNVATGNGCGFGIVVNTTHGTHIAHNQTTGNGGGILICCSDHNLVEDNMVSHNRHDALVVCCSDNGFNVIRHNRVTDNDESGIVVCCADGDQHNLITHNSVSGNAHQGILFEGANGNEVSANHVFANGDDIAIDGSRNTITGNQVSDAVGCEDQGCGFGIQLGSGQDNLIAHNDVTGTSRDGIRVDAFDPDHPTVDNVVRDNRVRDAHVDGIAVAIEGDGTVGALLIENNTAMRSGDDGFDIRNAASILTANVALRNGDLGFDAVPGVSDGGDNRAFGNGNPLQCTGVSCS